MLGQMQDWPLRVSSILDHAAKYHADRPLVTRTVEGPIAHTTWAETRTEALKVSQALARLGLSKGDRVGVMAWNTARHMAIWYGVPGAGGVLHSLNPRLFADQLVYIINHAEDRILMLDLDLVPVIEAIADRLETVRTYVIMTDRAHMPANQLNALCYGELIDAEDGDADWAAGDERDACGICYTSGTTGNPKGVIYSHRSNVIHALTMVQPDMLALSSNDMMMPVVPLFHANGWSLGYSAPMVGAAMMMPGRDLTPRLPA